MRLVLQHLQSTYFGVRNKCLQLLGYLGSVDKPLHKESEAVPGTSTAPLRDVQSLISDYFSDQDPRVRTAAIKAMVSLISIALTSTMAINERGGTLC